MYNNPYRRLFCIVWVKGTILDVCIWIYSSPFIEKSTFLPLPGFSFVVEDQLTINIQISFWVLVNEIIGECTHFAELKHVNFEQH